MKRARDIVRIAAAALAAVVVLALLAGCAGADAGTADADAADSTELHISAATTLKRAVEELIPEFEAAHPGVTIVGNYAASGVLQKQIEEGAPCDVFLSAGPKQVAALIEGGIISAEASQTLCSNDVAIIVPTDNPADIEGPDDLANAERLTTGNPDTAPFGTKSKEWLVNIGLWDELEPQIVLAENAAQAIDYIARGEVDGGLVFASEATDIDGVEIVYLAPVGELTTPVRYVLAPLVVSEQPDLADEFVAFMLAEQAQDVLAGWGFRPLTEME